jgi:hypothetical protein
MSIRRVISLAALAALGIAFVSADAFAARVTARGGAIADRGGAVAYRGGVGYRGGLYRGGYYRPGLGLAAGAVVGGAIAASQPEYGYGGYGYGGGYGSGYGSNPGYSYVSTSGYAGGCSTDGGMIMCNGRCWLNDNEANHSWRDCPAVHVRGH